MEVYENKVNENPTKENRNSLKNAKRDLKNSTRDNECLIRGCVPEKYIKVTSHKEVGIE